MSHYHDTTMFLLTLSVIIQCSILNVNKVYARAPIVDKLYAGITLAGKDQIHYYTPNNLMVMGSILTGMGIMANTSIDAEIRDGYQEYIRRSLTDEVASRVEPVGNRPYPHIIILSCASLNLLPDRVVDLPVVNTLALLGGQSLRIILMGVVPLSVFQRILGSPRPSQGPSTWTPFSKATGMSGHTFLGSVPFLAVYSVTDNVWLRCTAVTLSTFVGISRINDNKHYFSQVAGGWSMAFLAAHTIRKQTRNNKKVSLAITPQYIGLSIKL